MSKRITGMSRLARPVGSTGPFEPRVTTPERDLQKLVQTVAFTGVHIGNRHPRTYITAESRQVLVKGVSNADLADLLR